MHILSMKSIALILSLYLATAVFGYTRPNIVFVITDDQGYGDMGCHGHPFAITPHIDQLASESVGLEDYHVFPTCSPSRSAIMTGHWANRTGVWHTIMGRSMLRENEVTLGQMLKDAGYATGMFGKWHMGDNFPFRPEDRGFTEVYRHGGGGVGQIPDYWDNAYFDGSYYHNGKAVPAKGFCTDVFFGQAKRFIKESVEAKQPFFAYVSTNAPHGPLHAPQNYMDMYPDVSKRWQAFYGMVTNIDDNVGALRDYLAELGVTENTIFIYTTDNGTAGGGGYTAGMRGRKGSEYDGGHRVPFFMHYPAGGLTSEKKVKTLTHAVDIAPTLLDFCEADAPEGVKFDGRSIRSLLEKGDYDSWPERMLISDSQRVVDPIKWRKSSVMSQGWRLVNGEELYNMEVDGAQKKDVSAKHPERVKKMRAFYEAWWAELLPTFQEDAYIVIGDDRAPVVNLTSHDVIMEKVAWNQSFVRGLSEFEQPSFTGYWSLDVRASANYAITLRRWPAALKKGIRTPMEPGADVPGSQKPYRATAGDAIEATHMVLKVDGVELGQSPIKEGDTQIKFEVPIQEGKRKLSTYFKLSNGNELVVPFAEIELLK